MERKKETDKDICCCALRLVLGKKIEKGKENRGKEGERALDRERKRNTEGGGECWTWKSRK